MGNCVGGFRRRTNGVGWRRKRLDQPIVLAFLGLDNAGKTTILKALQGEDASSVHATMGFSRGEFAIQRSPIVAFDLGGAPRIRDIWKIYYAEIYGVVFVVDSAAPGRLAEARELVRQMRGHPDLVGKPFLFLLNKKDLPDALDEMSFSDALDLHAMAQANRTDVRVERVCGVKGVGKEVDPNVTEGLVWLLERVRARFDELHRRIRAAEQALAERQQREKLERQHRLATLEAERERAENQAAASVQADHQVPNGHLNAGFESEELNLQQLTPIVPIARFSDRIYDGDGDSNSTRSTEPTREHLVHANGPVRGAAKETRAPSTDEGGYVNKQIKSVFAVATRPESESLAAVNKPKSGDQNGKQADRAVQGARPAMPGKSKASFSDIFPIRGPGCPRRLTAFQVDEQRQVRALSLVRGGLDGQWSQVYVEEDAVGTLAGEVLLQAR